MLRDTATKHHHASNASQHPLDSSPAQASSTGFFFSSARRDTALNKSASAMGQAESSPRPPELDAGVQAQLSMPPPPSPQPKAKSRFGWPGRRKKSEDFTKLTTPPMPSPVPLLSSAPPSINNSAKGRELARQESDVSSVDSYGGSNMHELSRPPSRTSSAKQLTLQFASNTLSALKGKLNASQASIHSFRTGGPMSPTTPPPPLPPKPDLSRLSTSSSRSESLSGDWITMEKASKPLPSPSPDVPAPVTELEARHPESVPTATTAGTSTAAPAAPDHAHDVNVPQRRERERREGADAQTAKEIADDWRKSDSTLRTVRLVGVGSRTPRPLSLAESTNSNHTVLPTVGAGSPVGNLNMGAGKRLSALMTDADFGLKEVDSEEDDDEESVFPSAPPSAFNSVHSLQEQGMPFGSSAPTPTSSKPQPTPRRGSLSIRIGRFSGSKTRVSEHGQLDGSDSEVLSSSLSTQGTTGTDMGMLTANSSTTSVSSSSPGIGTKDSRPSIEIASSASIASSMSSEHHPDRYAHYKSNSKLEPWISLPPAASDSQASLSTSESTSTSSRTGSPSRHADTERSGKHAVNMNPPHGANLRPAHQRNRLQSIQARGFRQTAVSLTTGLAPAAGFARKAVDRLGRALAGSSTSLANHDPEEMPVPHAGGHKSSASASSAALFGQHAHGQHHRQHHLPQHPPSSSKKATRKHGTSPSGSWSVHSTSTSDTDGGQAGPYLGPCLRGPLIPVSNINKGLVFGRELELCVKDTACTDAVTNGVDGLSLEDRSLPALVVRCAQHIVKWGVQEEGLFRISGRSTHISKLRAEFDSGADYDLRECGPGEIDPHAVASIFKAYLRELPEPLLTRHLMPYFEAALTAENNMINATVAHSTGASGSGAGQNGGTEHKRVSGLPSSPRDSTQVRKAPSLSTFAVPALAPRTASHTLLSAISTLIARLPKENRDLLRTVTELIMATARASRETKMPLSNLLLVFCPSLLMGPPLLRVLCEGKDIWDGPLEDTKICPVLGEPSIPETSNDEEMEGKKNEVEEDVIRTSMDSTNETGLHHQGTIRRPQRASSEAASTKATSEEETIETGETVVVPAPTLPSLVLPSNDGEASVTSKHTKTDSLFSTSINLSSPDGNITHSSSSSDSLHTPPSSSPGSVSPNYSLAPTGTVTKPALDTTGLGNKILALRAQAELPSPLSPSAVKKAVRKSLIGNPVLFPLGMNRSCSGNGTAGSAPVTPIDLGGSDKLLLTSHSSSSPNLSKDSPSPSPTSTPPALGRRKSKASLLGLKSKRSLSSLLGRAQEQAQLRPLRSAVPDLTEEVGKEPAQPPRSSTPCPVLDLPDTSQIRFGEGLGLGIILTEEPERVKSGQMTDAPSTLGIPSYSRSPSPSPSPSQLRPQGTLSPSPMMKDRAESSSSAVTSNSVFYTPPTTTRALAPSVNNSLSGSGSIAPAASTSSSNSGSGSYSFLDFNLGKAGEEDDWAKSVLKAASSDA